MPLEGTVLYPVPRKTGDRWVKHHVVVTGDTLYCYKKADRQQMVKEFAFGTRIVYVRRGVSPQALAARARRANARARAKGKAKGGKGKGKTKGKGKGKVTKLKSIDHALTLSAGDDYVLLGARNAMEADMWYERLRQCSSAALRRVVASFLARSCSWFEVEALAAAEAEAQAAAAAGSQLLRPSPATGPQLVSQEAAAELFQLLHKHVTGGASVNSVAIFGAARQGKSTFMNLLADQTVFDVSHGDDPCSQGVHYSSALMKLNNFAAISATPPGAATATDRFEDQIRDTSLSGG